MAIDATTEDYRAKPKGSKRKSSYSAVDGLVLDNIAEELPENVLEEVGQEVASAYIADEQSRQEWLDDHDEWIKLAQQTYEPRNTPWPNSSAVKYPLITTAALQFHARSTKALLGKEQPIQGKVLGSDPTLEKAARAKRVGTFMSYQVMQQDKDWLDDKDRLFFVLSILGTAFTKTYYSPACGYNRAELVLPHELTVNYDATNWERARKTHVLYKTKNELVELINERAYRDILADLGEPSETLTDKDKASHPKGMSAIRAKGDTPFTILEQHGWWDLDGDGYAEPYVVTIDYATKKVLRIAARYEGRGLKEDDDGNIIKITPIEYFTLYRFMPAMDSVIYGIGFGTLLGPISEAVNTIINQLINAGTLSSMPSGFLAKGVRVARGGRMRFLPGEWKIINSSAADLKNGVYPLPIKEPSNALFQLLGMLVTSGEQVGNIAKLMLGESPGQNQPYSTTAAMLEQGLSVFEGIYKRIYRSLSSEYKKLFCLNRMYLDDAEYTNILDQEASVQLDFGFEGVDVVPEADPNMVHDIQKQMKADAIVKMAGAGMMINPAYATRTWLEAIGEDAETIEAAMQLPPPEPDFDQQIKIRELELKTQTELARTQSDTELKRAESQKEIALAMVNFMKAETMQDENAHQKATEILNLLMRQAEIQTERERLQLQEMKARLNAEVEMIENERDRLADAEKEAAKRSLDAIKIRMQNGGGQQKTEEE